MITEKIKKIIGNQLNLDLEELQEMQITDTLEELYIDSLDAVEIQMEIEEEFKIDISDNDAEIIFKPKSMIGDIIEYMKRRV